MTRRLALAFLCLNALPLLAADNEEGKTFDWIKTPQAAEAPKPPERVPNEEGKTFPLGPSSGSEAGSRAAQAPVPAASAAAHEEGKDFPKPGPARPAEQAAAGAASVAPPVPEGRPVPVKAGEEG